MGLSPESRQRVTMFGVPMDAVTMGTAIEQIYNWVEQPQPQCRYVVTPNVDHTVIYQRHPGLQAAYSSASLILADGMPVVLASRLLRKGIPEKVSGSDLVPNLFAGTNPTRTLRVFLLGAAAGVADRAAEEIHRRWPYVSVVGTYSPPIGFEQDESQNKQILKMIEEASPDVLAVGLGAPKQELWVARHQAQLNARVALCIGATIDFLAGERKRAPVWMQRVGLEWFHRVCSEPRRLVKRYAHDAWVFPQLVWREWRSPSST